MRYDKKEAFELRKQGKTYREIQTSLSMSRSTLCKWFRNEEWSRHIKQKNTEKHIKLSIEHLKKLNTGRKLKLEEKYRKVEEEANKEFEKYKSEPLFNAGLMLYAGEGDKVTKGVIRLANTDFFAHKIFINFIKKYTNKQTENIKFSVLLYPDLDINNCINIWSKELNIPIYNFHKPQVIQGRSKTRKLRFGVGSTIISDSFLKIKMLRWIELVNKNLS